MTTPGAATHFDIMCVGATNTRDVTAVKYRVDIGTEMWLVDGSSKRDSHDKPDPDIGLELAHARALRRIADKLEKRARGRVKHADDLRTERRREKKEPGVFKPGDRVKIRETWHWRTNDSAIPAGHGGEVVSYNPDLKLSGVHVELDPGHDWPIPDPHFGIANVEHA